MYKVLLIGFKDLKMAFRDRPALTFMLLAPFLLTLGLGAATGRFSGGNTSGVSDIPVVLVNLDQAQLGNTLVEVFRSADLDELLTPEEVNSVQEARRRVDDDRAAAAVIIPEGFTASIIPGAGGSAAAPGSDNEIRQIELYVNPTRNTSAGVIQAILETFLTHVETARVGGEVTMQMLLESGRLSTDPQVMAQVGNALGQRFADVDQGGTVIPLRQVTAGGQEVKFDILAYMAPSMALMFLMFTVSYGGRSILVERNRGTLPRLLISPTSTAQILGGKVLGVYMIGVAQVGILVLASTLLFGLKWGNPLGVVILILAAVLGATGWGMLLTALGRTPGQVSGLGSALMLTFGILGGNFVDPATMPEWLRWVGRITPNAWGLDGFTVLAVGGGLAQVLPSVLALMGMGVLLFAISALLFRRRGIAQW